MCWLILAGRLAAGLAGALYALRQRQLCSRMSCRFLCLLMASSCCWLGGLESMAGPIVAPPVSLAFGGASAHHTKFWRAPLGGVCESCVPSCSVPAWHCRDASENLAFGVAPHCLSPNAFRWGRAMSVAGELTVSIHPGRPFGGVKAVTTSPSSLIRARWLQSLAPTRRKSLTCLLNMLVRRSRRTRARYVSTATSSTALARLRSGGSHWPDISKSPSTFPSMSVRENCRWYCCRTTKSSVVRGRPAPSYFLDQADRLLDRTGLRVQARRPCGVLFLWRSKAPGSCHGAR